MDFSNTEKLDILLKDSFNVPSTNENIAWYLETNADYSTWTNGSDILLDTFATSNVWASSTFLNSTKMNNLYGLSSSDSPFICALARNLAKWSLRLSKSLRFSRAIKTTVLIY